MCLPSCGLSQAFGLVSGGLLKALSGVSSLSNSAGPHIASAILFVFYGVLMYTVGYWGKWLHRIRPVYEVDSCGKECMFYLDVWRMGILLIVFHTAFALLMLGARRRSSVLAGLNNGFWTLKGAAMVAMAVASFWVPIGAVSLLYTPVILAGTLYVILQAALLVDAAYGWAEDLVDAANDDGEYAGLAKVSLVVLTAGMYLLLIVGFVVLYWNFSSDKELTLTSVILLFALAMPACSLLPAVQEANPSAGLFQAAILAVYALLVLLSAFITKPGNSEAAGIPQDYRYLAPLVTISSAVFLLITVVRGALRLGSGDGIAPVIHEISTPQGKDREDLFAGDSADGDEEVGMAYTMQHGAFAMAACYMTLALTFWQFANLEPVQGGSRPIMHLQNASLAFWVRIMACVGTCLMYLWSLFAPLILEERSFY